LILNHNPLFTAVEYAPVYSTAPIDSTERQYTSYMLSITMAIASLHEVTMIRFLQTVGLHSVAEIYPSHFSYATLYVLLQTVGLNSIAEIYATPYSKSVCSTHLSHLQLAMSKKLHPGARNAWLPHSRIGRTRRCAGFFPDKRTILHDTKGAGASSTSSKVGPGVSTM
jgi:hypothetical protein